MFFLCGIGGLGYVIGEINNMNFVSTFLCMQSQIRVWHWQTDSFAEHQALGSLYESLNELVDEFVEVFSGMNGVPKARDSFKTECINYPGKDAIIAYFDDKIQWLQSEVPSQVGEDRTDLLNIRDEIVAALNKTKYLLRLK